MLRGDDAVDAAAQGGQILVGGKSVRAEHGMLLQARSEGPADLDGAPPVQDRLDDAAFAVQGRRHGHLLLGQAPVDAVLEFPRSAAKKSPDMP